MKAIVQAEYGSPVEVLELKEIDKPQVKNDEVLVRVNAACVHQVSGTSLEGCRTSYASWGPDCSNQRTVFRERMWKDTLRRSART